jgi:hypothetical protein
MQDGLTAAHYRRRRVEEIETAVIEGCSQAVASMSDFPFRMNSGIRTSTLSYEYQSYLFDLRRCFEYLGSGLVGAFGIKLKRPGWVQAKAKLNEELKGSALPQSIRAEAEAMAQRLEQVSSDFRKVLESGSPRNRLAHRDIVGAGSLQIYLERGREPHIAIEGGGEELSIRQEGTTGGFV